ncbi:MAG: hypothetical protein M3Q03_09075 [Chloroflexota bacterium]|nr:hypothetical protein [Chloroflexota bacterium]
MNLDSLSRDYLALSFGIGRHLPGYVDSYFGPAEVRENTAAAEPATPEGLLEQAEVLAEQVADGEGPPDRLGFLGAQARAMIATCRKLAGDDLSYADEVRGCFDIAPTRTPEAVFEQAIAELDDLLPGDGPVRERMVAWRRRFEVAPEVARTLLDVVMPEVRRRTLEVVDLPPEEAVEFAFVSDKPWSGYNWYLGRSRSRVELNTDLPIRANALTGLICHEAYPGHHTEWTLKEHHLYRELGLGEFAIQLIHTPQAVIAEGIATLAESILFPDGDLHRWQAEHLYPLAGLEGDPERETRLDAAQRALRAVNANAALLLHADGAPEDEVVAYIARYGLRDEPEARQNLRFIADPLWRAYVFTYHAGRDLLGRWLSNGSRTERFRTLLTEPVWPSEVEGWIAAEAGERATPR